MSALFADILLPLPLKGTFTYAVPDPLVSQVQFGVRVVVPFGRNKFYSGIVTALHANQPTHVTVKSVVEVIDEAPIISPLQFELWKWMADYYMCALGEVMACSLPSALKLTGEVKVAIHPAFDGDISHLTPTECAVVEAVASGETISLDKLAKTIQIQKIIPIVKSLVKKQILLAEDEIRDRYKPQKEVMVALAQPYADNEQELYALLDRLEKSKSTEKRARVILALLAILQSQGIKRNYGVPIPRKRLLEEGNVSPSSLQTLIKDDVLVASEVVVSRLESTSAVATPAAVQLSLPQQKAYEEIKRSFGERSVSLLHGVTGSGKTEIYIRLIEETLRAGKQVLYLLPEIALTSQIVNRLRRYFGSKVGVYHSRFNEYEKVEIWNRVLRRSQSIAEQSDYSLILGARSALLLPFDRLGLIIVDEEHDASYKQSDPAPRYHARDSAIVLASLHKANILLGTATPSLETFYNVARKMYGYIPLTQRYAESKLPDVWVVNMGETMRQGKARGLFSQFLVDKIAAALERKEQVILFQNRRGYAVRLFCHACQAMPTCQNCDVTLTYHKRSNVLKCHYCGYTMPVPTVCPECGSPDIEMKGFGTEKIEDTLAQLFPAAVIQRMDLDTTRSKKAYQDIITQFEQHKTDILVGTQMVTKGLDFDRVSVVGVISADAMLSYPDFRSFERAFQIISQVSGRAGRKDVPGEVIIQTFQPHHPALKYVCSNDFKAMYQSQIAERQRFQYPPICRLIRVTLKHTDEAMVSRAAMELANLLIPAFQKQVLGPEAPLVSRVQTYYLQDFWIKLPKNNQLVEEKIKLEKIISSFRQETRFKSVQIVINVDV